MVLMKQALDSAIEGSGLVMKLVRKVVEDL